MITLFGKPEPTLLERLKESVGKTKDALADTLDAMTTNRPYQSAMDLDYALGRIKALTGSKFDQAVVNALEAAVKAGKIRLSAVEVNV